MKRVEFIDIVKDKLGEMNVNRARKHFHPEIVAYTLNTHHLDIIKAAYQYDNFSIEGGFDVVKGLTVYEDKEKEQEEGHLFCINPTETIPIDPVTQGVMRVKKVGSTSIKFEPWSDLFEDATWNRLSATYNNKVRYKVTPGQDTSDISSSATGLSEFEQIVWFRTPSASYLKQSDTVDLVILPTFYAHGDQQEVYLPNIPGLSGNELLINMAIRDILSKLGIKPEGYEYGEKEDK
jgi:hypothetical protein